MYNDDMFSIKHVELFQDRSWRGERRAAQEWQHVAGTRVSLYAAYYDERAPQRYVRILATFHGT